MEKVVANLESLAIIIESFKLYKETSLRENIVASMQKKMFEIDTLLKKASKHQNFGKCSDALSLPQQLLQFILENSEDNDIVYSLAELLSDTITINCNLFTFLRGHREDLKNTLLEPSASRYSKMVLAWMGKQV